MASNLATEVEAKEKELKQLEEQLELESDPRSLTYRIIKRKKPRQKKN